MQLREGGVGRPNDSQTGAVVEVRTHNRDIPGGDRDPITAVASRSGVQGWSTLDLDAGSTIHPYFHELLPDQRDSFTGEVGNDWRSDEERSWWAIRDPCRGGLGARYRGGTYFVDTPVNQLRDGEPAVRVEGLRKSFGELEVLRGVDFDVARGSIFALLGSNGAGKTTAVKILSTLLRPDGGSAVVNAFDVTTRPGDVRESISLTGQFAAVDEILTARENLVLIAKLRHLPDPAGTADALLEQFSLAGAASRRVSTYSGGMRRRLDIAMSLIGDPPVIFLDEPTTGLDPEARVEVWRTVKELAGRGTTVLLTTQYLEEAEHLADRIAILHRGRIIVNGSLDDLKQHLPPTKVEYVEKQPTLEDVFFAIVGDKSDTTRAAEPRPTTKD